MDGSTPIRERACAGAIIVTADGRYLLQLRDDKPDIRHPGAWGAFGGHLEAGETPDEAIRRELDEELGFDDAQCRLFCRFECTEDGGVLHKIYFLVPVTADRLARFVQTEGAGMGIFMPQAIERLPNVVAHDRAALLLHSGGTLVRAGTADQA